MDCRDYGGGGGAEERLITATVVDDLDISFYDPPSLYGTITAPIADMYLPATVYPP